MRKALLVLIFLTSCVNSEKKHYFQKSSLEKISKMALIAPPPPIITFCPVYFVGSNDSIYESTFNNMQSIYQTLYINKYSLFSDFLYNVFNQRVKINTNAARASLYYSRSFLPNDLILKLYKKAGLKGISSKYCDYQNKSTYTLKRINFTGNEINSISYYFFINQFIRFNNDYKATISFRALDSIIN